MKKLIWTILFLSNTIFAQEFKLTGHWKGMLIFGERAMDIILTFDHVEGHWSGTLSSQKQQLKAIPMGDIVLDGDSLSFKVPMAGGSWKGMLSDGQLKGNWSQLPYTLPLNFERLNEAPDLTIKKRKQTPTPPYPYIEDEVVIKNTLDQVRLAGTLTIPPGSGPFPAAILLTVAGPNDRNQSHGAPVHQPYKVLADFLARNGIASLRMDDRGVGGSTGDLFQSTIDDFANDANAAFDYLISNPIIDNDRIGFIGNSEGSLVGPLAAFKNQQTAFIITLGGIGVPGKTVILDQGAALGRLNGIEEEKIQDSQSRTKALFEILISEKDSANIASEVLEILEKTPSSVMSFMVPKSTEEQVKLFTSPWYIYQVKYDPAQVLQSINCPFLALHGSHDPFVDPDRNLQAIGEYLSKGGNNNYALIKLKNINHIFQDAQSGLPKAYTSNEVSFSPRAMEIMLSWLKTVWSN